MPLSEVALRQAKPDGKRRRLYDAGGLYLEITAAGSRVWRLKYRYGGKERVLRLGTYPQLGLKEARRDRDAARLKIDAGIDPVVAERESAAAESAATDCSLEAVAREWHAGKSDTWAVGHAKRIRERLEADLFPYLGTRPVSEIEAPELLAALRRVEDRGAIETAHRLRRIAGQVFRYAIATGRATRNPAADLEGALKSFKNGHFAAVTDPVRLGAVLRTMHAYTGTLPVRIALRLVPMLLVRPGELRSMRWCDVDLDTREWRFTTSKTESLHIVPLADQAVTALRELHALTGRGSFVFPNPRSPRDRCMSENAIRGAMLALGLEGREVTAHGFRATARTLLDEIHGMRPDIIEHQLAHAVKDPNGRAYNRTTFLDERRQMMQLWADYLDELRCGSKVYAIGKAASA